MLKILILLLLKLECCYNFSCLIGSLKFMDDKLNIILIEDNGALGRTLRDYLVRHQHNVTWEKNGISAWTTLQSKVFDAVILDPGLPGITGEEILQRMRQKKINTPVTIITVDKSISNSIKRLDAGADCYLMKPFSEEVLHAHIRCIQRRVVLSRADPTITIGDLSLNPSTRLVFKSGDEIKLTRREFELLQLLMENNGRVISRKQIATKLYGLADDNIYSNAFEVHIYHLRKKCGAKIIKTHRYFGYGIDVAHK